MSCNECNRTQEHTHASVNVEGLKHFKRLAEVEKEKERRWEILQKIMRLIEEALGDEEFEERLEPEIENLLQGIEDVFLETPNKEHNEVSKYYNN